MGGDKKEYDLICSLGENCSVAHNLRYRNMRPFSLPFNYYDFSKTNFEWEFLDNIKWSKKFGSNKFPKKLCSLSLFSYKIKVTLDRKE